AKGLAIARKRYPEPPGRPRPPPLPAETRLQPSGVIKPPSETGEPASAETAKIEPGEAAQPAPPADLLGKWFDVYGLSKAIAEGREPGPLREASPPLPEEIAVPGDDDEAVEPPPIEPPVESVATPELPIIEPVEAPKPAPSFFQMRTSVRARF